MLKCRIMNLETAMERKLKSLQDYTFIALDIFQKNLQNKGISNQLDVWLTFLSVDEPETIVNLITTFPQFKPMYDEVYQLCRNTEKVMEMFSKELQELDRNTVQYMINEMQDTINAQKEQIETAHRYFFFLFSLYVPPSVPVPPLSVSSVPSTEKV